MGHDDGLGKYPIVIAVGEDLTRAQTNEVMLRTNRWHMLSCNDEHWDDIVTCILGHADILDANPSKSEHCPEGCWDYQLRWDLAAQFGEHIDALSLFALDNEAIMTSCVHGPCGWLDWSGRIHARYTEGSKWTSIEEVEADWTAIADAFPFLRLRSQLAAGTYLGDLPAGTVGAEWIIEGGTATRVDPGPPLVPEPRWYHRPIDRWYEFDWWGWPVAWPLRELYYRRQRRLADQWPTTGTWPLYTTWNERCVSAARLIDAVDQARKARMPDTFTVTDDHLTLLRHANFRFNETFYNGSAEIDPKRPYKEGSAFWGAAAALDPDGVPTEDDEVADAYELEHYETYMRLHRDTATVIEIAARTGSFQAGTYERTSPWHDDWQRIEPTRGGQS